MWINMDLQKIIRFVIKFALLLFCYKGHKFFYKGIDKSIPN
jgi:hypothetical protein